MKCVDLQDDTDDSHCIIYKEMKDSEEWHDLSEEYRENCESEHLAKSSKTKKQSKKKPGRKAKWSHSLINDMVDIIIDISFTYGS